MKYALLLIARFASLKCGTLVIATQQRTRKAA
jgi:hypothetical protein